MALTKAILNKHVSELKFPDENSPLDQEPARSQYSQLRSDLHTFYTELGNDADRGHEARELAKKYEILLVGLGLDDTDQQLTNFSNDLAAAIKTTQYLCWIEAEPGEVVQLRVAHSTRDPMHKLEEGTLCGLVQAIATGVFGRLLRKDLKTCREIWNRWYVQYGLAPIPYAFNTPTYNYTTSYYSTLEPPENTVVDYLDWERGNNWDNHAEIDSSLDSAHIFHVDASTNANGDRPGSGTNGSTDSNDVPAPVQQPIATRAYVRCTPSHHKLLLGTALVSLLLVALLAVGRFPSKLGNPLEALLTATPSILVAYLAQQQRHYYAHALRRVRGILWIYLVCEVIFLAAVAFSGPVDGAGTAGVSFKATIAAWVLALSSVFVFAWQFPLGQSYERAVRFFTRRKKNLVGRDKGGLPTRWQKLGRWLAGLRWDSSFTEDWHCYEVAVEQYSRLIRRAVIWSVLLTLLLLLIFWHPASPRQQSELEYNATLVTVQNHGRIPRAFGRSSIPPHSHLTTTNISNPSW
ncbi:MAG TPA: hypothetical protein VFH99_03125 [Candidatus Saccharimonadales bacterium]|nr:hypothetical protein [Candidatus Saccharimonadales bacterium]